MANISITREMLAEPWAWHGDKRYKRDSLPEGVESDLYIRWRYRTDRLTWREVESVEDTGDLPVSIEVEADREVVGIVDAEGKIIRLVLATDAEGVQRGANEAAARKPTRMVDYHFGADPAEDARRRQRAIEAAEEARKREADRRAAHEAAQRADAERAAYYARQRAEHEARLAEARRLEAEREVKRERWEAFRADPKWTRIPTLIQLIQPVRPGKGPLGTNGSGVSISEDDTRLLVEYEREERRILLDDWGHAPHPAHIGYFYARALPPNVNYRKLNLTFTADARFRIDVDETRTLPRDPKTGTRPRQREKRAETFATLDLAIEGVYYYGGMFPAVTDMDA